MESLLGTYQGVATENMDAYFKARGMLWPLRKMILSLMNPAEALREFGRSEDGSYFYRDNGSTRTPVLWKFRLNEQFKAISYDGKEHKIVFEYDNTRARLFEKHVLVEDPSNEQTYEHFLDKDKLIWVLRIKDTEAKWIYERKQ